MWQFMYYVISDSISFMPHQYISPSLRIGKLKTFKCYWSTDQLINWISKTDDLFLIINKMVIFNKIRYNKLWFLYRIILFLQMTKINLYWWWNHLVKVFYHKSTPKYKFRIYINLCITLLLLYFIFCLCNTVEINWNFIPLYTHKDNKMNWMFWFWFVFVTDLILDDSFNF